MPKTSPWDAARKLHVIRGNHLWAPKRIDPGVNYFVLMLERLGCTTVRSCEGHPDDFCIAFHGPEHVARTIAAAGYLDVKLWKAAYRIVWETEFGLRIDHAAGWTVRERNKLFRRTAEEWARCFGPLDLAAAEPRGEFVDPRRPLLVEMDRLVKACDLLLMGEIDEVDLEMAMTDAEMAMAREPVSARPQADRASG